MKNVKLDNETKCEVMILDGEGVDVNGNPFRRAHWEETTEEINLGKQCDKSKVLATKWTFPKKKSDNPFSNMFGGMK